MSKHSVVFLALTTALAANLARADYKPIAVKAGGEIRGKVTLPGPAPELPPKPRDRNPDVCGASGPDESLVVSAGGGVKNAIVYLKDIKSGKPMPTASADLDQKGCAYVPHVLAVPVGTTVNLLNGDAVLHNIHTEGTTSFNYAMPMTVKKIPKKLTKPGFSSVKCDVHPWMSGVLAVMDNPYFAVTSEDGSFDLTDIPPGTYALAVWHESLHAPPQTIVVAANGKATATFSMSK